MRRIYINGRIYTMDAAMPYAEAMCTEDGKFLKVGTNFDMEELQIPGVEIIDLNQQSVYPGFIDSHMHLGMLGSNLFECDLVNTGSIEELIERMKAYQKEKQIPKGEWIFGKGWNEDYFDSKRLPSREDLDQISTEHNICLTRGCYHMCVVNSNVLDFLGVDRDNHIIEGGIYDVDENGVPTGICREAALKQVYSAFPPKTKETFKEYIRLSSKYLLSRGLTSVSTDDFMLPGFQKQDVLDAYVELRDANELKLRITEQCLLPDRESLEAFIAKGYRTGKGDDRFKIGQLKLLADGNLGTRTAYMEDAYADDPGNHGFPQYKQEDLNELVQIATAGGFQIAVHAIGDKASGMVITSLEALPEELKQKDLRANLVHCQVLNEGLMDKMQELGVVANVQPIFLHYDVHMAEPRIGAKKLKTSYNWNTMLKRGMHMAFGSDSPIELPDPLFGIYSAVNRRDLNGYPEGGWYPEEKITVDEAISCYTMGSAYATFDDHRKGSIRSGKLADFIVLSENLQEVDPLEIKNLQVLSTYVNGEKVHG